MPKRSDKPVAQGPRSRRFPLPSYYGLTGKFWSRIEKLSLEQEDLRDRDAKNSRRRAELVEELDFQRRRLEEQRAVAARNEEPEPDDTYLKLTEKEIAKHDDRARALTRAAQMAENELAAAIREVPPEVLQELREKAEKHEERYKQLVAQAQAERELIGGPYALHLWLREEIPFPHFSATPPTDYAGRPWYERPLDWGDEPAEVISTTTAPGLVG